MTRPTESGKRVWHVYVIRCRDDSLYTGISPDVSARVMQHSAGTGARYLRGRGPLTLVASVSVGTRGGASRVEYAFKQLSKLQKERCLIVNDGLERFAARVCATSI